MYHCYCTFVVAGVGFEPHDLRVMSPTSYRTAPSRDIKQRLPLILCYYMQKMRICQAFYKNIFTSYDVKKFLKLYFHFFVQAS